MDDKFTHKNSEMHTNEKKKIVCLMCSLRHVETVVKLFAYAVSIASMILHTARFLCAIHTEICIDAIDHCCIYFLELTGLGLAHCGRLHLVCSCQLSKHGSSFKKKIMSVRCCSI